MRKAVGVCGAVAALVLVVGCGSTGSTSATASDKETFTIGVAEFADIQPVRDAVAGLKASLGEHGYKEGGRVRFVVKNAQGQTNNASLVARQLVQEKPDLIYALGTPLIVALAQQTTSIPILFGGMTDPVGAKVVDSADSPGRNVTGTSDWVPPEVYFDLFEQVLPDAQRVGVLGNPAEPNTQTALEAFEEEGEKRGIEVTTASVANTAAIVPALQSLRGRVDVLTFPADNTVLSGLATVVRIATQYGLPVIAATSDAATEGGLVGVGADYRALGEINGDQAAEILGGEVEVGDIPVHFPTTERVQIAVNEVVAGKLGIPVDKLPKASG